VPANVACRTGERSGHYTIAFSRNDLVLRRSTSIGQFSETRGKQFYEKIATKNIRKILDDVRFKRILVLF